MPPSAAHLRPYRDDDLPRLYEICLRTGAAGQDASAFVTDRSLFGAIFAAPYATLAPEYAVILDDGSGTAVGYVLGAPDTRAFEARCEAEWWPSLRARHPPGTGDGLDALLIGAIHEPQRAADDVVVGYPSHLHIDLLPAFQGTGWGRAMMERMQALLLRAGSTGVHVGVSTANERALGFYRRLGYGELSADPISRCLGYRLS